MISRDRSENDNKTTGPGQVATAGNDNKLASSAKTVDWSKGRV
jgi:hypothetical protein